MGRGSAMHVDVIRSHQRAADGSQREYESFLLRRSFRDARGSPRKETLANLSMLPEDVITTLRRALKGDTLVSVDEVFRVERSRPHGALAAAHAMAKKLRVKELLGPDCRERDIVYSLIVSRVVLAQSKLSTLAGWSDSTLGIDQGCG